MPDFPGAPQDDDDPSDLPGWYAVCVTTGCPEEGIHKPPLGPERIPDTVQCGICMEPCRIDADG